MKSSDTPSTTRQARPPTHPRETRYSLVDMLAELEEERDSGSFAMEKLNQAEIGKLFEKPRKRRAKKA